MCQDNYPRKLVSTSSSHLQSLDRTRRKHFKKTRATSEKALVLFLVVAFCMFALVRIWHGDLTFAPYLSVSLSPCNFGCAFGAQLF